MTNYEIDIMELLNGVTPKQKYEYLKSIIKIIEEIENKKAIDKYWDECLAEYTNNIK